MAKVIIIGVLTELDEVQVKESYSSQQARICVQEYDSETGKPREPQVFPVTFFNKKIKECMLPNFKDQKVRVVCYLKSAIKDKDGKTFINLLLNGHSVELV